MCVLFHVCSLHVYCCILIYLCDTPFCFHERDWNFPFLIYDLLIESKDENTVSLLASLIDGLLISKCKILYAHYTSEVLESEVRRTEYEEL